MSDERFALATGPLPLPRIVEAARDAERLGYEAVMIGEGGMHVDAFVASAVVLGATARVRCGPGIANVVERHPVTLARAAATLERLAPGRALLGLGRGDPAWVASLGGARRGEGSGSVPVGSAADGAPAAPSSVAAPGPRSFAALEDAVLICRDVLAGRPAAHEGPGWSARVAALPPELRPQHRVPLLLAAVGPRTLRLAGALADAVLLNYGAPVEYVRWAVAEVAAGARAAGRDPVEVDVFGFLFAVCTDAAGAAERLDRLRAELAALHGEPGEGRWLTAQVGAPARWDDDAVRRFAVVGTRDECLRRIEEYRDAGVRCPVLMPSAMRALHDS